MFLCNLPVRLMFTCLPRRVGLKHEERRSGNNLLQSLPIVSQNIYSISLTKRKCFRFISEKATTTKKMSLFILLAVLTHSQKRTGTEQIVKHTLSSSYRQCHIVHLKVAFIYSKKPQNWFSRLMQNIPFICFAEAKKKMFCYYFIFVKYQPLPNAVHFGQHSLK